MEYLHIDKDFLDKYTEVQVSRKNSDSTRRVWNRKFVFKRCRNEEEIQEHLKELDDVEWNLKLNNNMESLIDSTHFFELVAEMNRLRNIIENGK